MLENVLKQEKPAEKSYMIALKFENGDREYLDASEIKIVNGCLIVVDPKNCVPCEVHCYPLAQIRSFIFDYEAITDGKAEIS